MQSQHDLMNLQHDLIMQPQHDLKNLQYDLITHPQEDLMNLQHDLIMQPWYNMVTTIAFDLTIKYLYSSPKIGTRQYTFVVKRLK